MGKLTRYEIGLVKAMLAAGGKADQDILAYFTWPTRSVNHREVAQIRTGERHTDVPAAQASELADFIAEWPEVDPDSGLSLNTDQLLVKAREAMVAAVHSFNGAGLTFRSELFIVTAVIGWTYLMHAWFLREGIDVRYYEGAGAERRVKRTPGGAEKYWELSHCLRHARCPLSLGGRNNLSYLLELRHEIEHRSTNRQLDDALSAKLQACCINFNDALVEWFGSRFALDRRLSLALQFRSLDPEQTAQLRRANLPQNISTVMDAFEAQLTPEQYADPRYAYRVALVPRSANRASSADHVVEFVRGDTEAAEEINRVLLREVERRKYRPGEVVMAMRAEGYRAFNMHQHTQLWRRLDGKNPAHAFGTLVAGTWYWYEAWLRRVREECAANPGLYGFEGAAVA
ncbi:MAG TPA: DUF3644 domain-containing protein [Allosphingosinicella sp.]|jgi:hypothetical protein